MSRVIQIQTNFASGALDPLLRARIDLQQYYNALETAENVFCFPRAGSSGATVSSSYSSYRAAPTRKMASR